MNTPNAHKDVAQVLKQLNQAWIEGRFDRLTELVHPDVVLVTPGFEERIHGREAYVSGHRDFAENATVHDFSESAADVDVIGDVAVVNYRYEMDYDRSGQRYASTGRDLYVLHNTGGRWLVVWRTILDVDERAV